MLYDAIIYHFGAIWCYNLSYNVVRYKAMQCNTNAMQIECECDRITMKFHLETSLVFHESIRVRVICWHRCLKSTLHSGKTCLRWERPAMPHRWTQAKCIAIKTLN